MGISQLFFRKNNINKIILSGVITHLMYLDIKINYRIPLDKELLIKDYIINTMMIAIIHIELIITLYNLNINLNLIMIKCILLCISHIVFKDYSAIFRAYKNKFKKMQNKSRLLNISF